MLGRLFSSFTPVANTDSARPESSLEEIHTRALLFPDAFHPSYRGNGNLPTSPSSPSSNVRPGAYDDHTAYDDELDATKIRVLVAQDAFGSQDKPSLLFDSRGLDEASGPVRAAGLSARHLRSPSLLPVKPGLRSPALVTNTTRQRSSTVSGSVANWTGQPGRDVDPKDSVDLLECMFGASNAAKAGSGETKMHVISADTPRATNTVSPGIARPGQTPSHTREPLARAQTHGNLSNVLNASNTDSAGSFSHDLVLITRIFNVDLPTLKSLNSTPTTDTGISTQKKRPKLKELRTTAYAASLLIELPRMADSRPVSRRLGSPPGPSASSSYGSDMQSSWTILDALPSSLPFPRSGLGDHTDHRIERLVRNWDIIVRSLSALEKISCEILASILKQVDARDLAKTPKEKSMQRTNHLHLQVDPWALANVKALHLTAEAVVQRLYIGYRIPRVAVGIGLAPGGHFLEEARTVIRLCGSRQHNFLYTLLTAFLGLHTDWLAHFTPSAIKARPKVPRLELDAIQARTVIITNNRSLARRTIFLLASFLQNQRGTDIFQSSASSTSFILHSPPDSQLFRMESLRRRANRRIRESRLKPNLQDAVMPVLIRKPSETPSVRTTSTLPILANDIRKSSATTTSTATPDPATPVALMTGSDSQPKDSYFPATMVSMSRESASSDLARLLRRNSSSYGSTFNGPSTGSTKWGSLLSGFFSKGESSGTSNTTVPSGPYRASGEGSVERFGSQGSSKLGQSDDAIAGADMNEDNSGVIESPRATEIDDTLPSLPQPIPPRLKAHDDGVVDVDINIPGFASSSFDARIRSPGISTSRQSPSTNSIDGRTSIYSTKSHADVFSNRQSPGHNNVAGFLRRHHIDFALQAVKPYPELDKDIRNSMASEATPQALVSVGDRWVTVGTTLIADCCQESPARFTIKRLTLKRRFPLSTRESESPNSEPEEMYLEEIVTESDPTLTDAIEQLTVGSLAPSPPTTMHSRTVSNSTASTKNNTPLSVPSSLSANRRLPDHISRDPQMVVKALQDVVKSVSDELHSQQQGQEMFQNEEKPATVAAEKEENALREGVKRWLCNVEQTEVW